MAFEASRPNKGQSKAKQAHKRKQEDDSVPRRRKRNKANPYEGGVSRPKKHSIAPLNTRIRDLRRQLAKMDNLPADIRVAKERELAACERELQAERSEKLRQEMISRYHMVRFFDRRKAERRLKRAKKALADAEGAGLEGELERRKQDVCEKETEIAYAQYYPLMIKYESLFPGGKGKGVGEVEESLDKEEPKRNGSQKMWERVQDAMKKGTKALMELRESGPVEPAESVQDKLDTSAGSKSLFERAKQKNTKNGDMVAAQEDDSDGEFFE